MGPFSGVPKTPLFGTLTTIATAVWFYQGCSVPKSIPESMFHNLTKLVGIGTAGWKLLQIIFQRTSHKKRARKPEHTIVATGRMVIRLSEYLEGDRPLGPGQRGACSGLSTSRIKMQLLVSPRTAPPEALGVFGLKLLAQAASLLSFPF